MRISGLACAIGLLLAMGAACQAAPATPTAIERAPVSPSPSSTVTPSPSPSPPTFTSTVPPARRWFTEDFEAESPYWVLRSTGAHPDPVKLVIDRGYMVLSIQAPSTWAYAIYDPYSYIDVRVGVRLEFRPGADGSAGVICRYDPDSGWYELNIYPDGAYAILFGQWLAEDVVRYTPLVVDEAEVIGEGVNEVALLCEGDVLTPYVNGVQLRSRVESRYVLTKGSVGISGASFERTPLVVTYDRFLVAEP